MAAGPKRERGGADFGGPRRHRSSKRRRRRRRVQQATLPRRPAHPTSVASSRPPCRAGRTRRGGRRQAGATDGPPARRRRGAPSPVSAMAAAEEVGALDPAGSRPCRRPRRTSLPCAGPRAAAGGRAARVPLLPPYLDAGAGAARRPRRLPAPAILLPGGHSHQRGLPRAPPAPMAGLPELRPPWAVAMATRRRSPAWRPDPAADAEVEPRARLPRLAGGAHRGTNTRRGVALPPAPGFPPGRARCSASTTRVGPEPRGAMARRPWRGGVRDAVAPTRDGAGAEEASRGRARQLLCPGRTDVVGHVGGQTRSKGFWTSSDTLN